MQPVFLVGSDGRLFFRNRLATELPGFDTCSGKVTLADPQQNNELADFIHQLVDTPLGTVLGPHSVCDGSCGFGYLVFLVPIDLGAARPAAVRTGLMSVYAPSEKSADAEGLRMLFGLSNAEARIASMIIQGGSVASVARDLNVSIGTVRTHLKSIFRKARVNRQQDLVRVATSTRIAQQGYERS